MDAEGQSLATAEAAEVVLGAVLAAAEEAEVVVLAARRRSAQSIGA